MTGLRYSPLHVTELLWKFETGHSRLIFLEADYPQNCHLSFDSQLRGMAPDQMPDIFIHHSIFFAAAFTCDFIFGMSCMNHSKVGLQTVSSCSTKITRDLVFEATHF